MDSLAAWYDAYAPALYRAAQTMTGSPHDAADLVQEVFLSVARLGPRLADVRDVQTYLFAALRRAAWRLARQRRRHRQVLFNHPPTDQADPFPTDDRLQRALACLPPEQRQVLALKIDGGLTFAQIAMIMNTSPNTAASRYRYALQKLRDCLECQ